MKGWQKSELSDLVLLQRGFDITKAQQQEGIVPIISSSGTTQKV
jgi:type I restriction enzyme S subunit